MKFLVTGGLGFIGSAVVRHLLTETDHEVVNLDKVSYSSTHGSVAAVADDRRYRFAAVDLVDKVATEEAVSVAQPDIVLHLAAESHVDRSIDGPADFLQSNVMGTFHLLEAVRPLARAGVLQRFVHVSTDEVFGSLPLDGSFFDESTPYDPRSPYSASKAASDHLVRAWGETYELPISVTNCSNNYGPFQFPEKLIPLMIIKALGGEPLPVYGAGANIRDWLFVDDHVRALMAVAERGADGDTYAIGGNNELTNLEVVQRVCDGLDQLVGAGHAPRRDLITFVEDRPGHDLRYAIDASRIERTLGWTPSVDFEQGLERTLEWYLANREWWQPLVDARASQRLGLGAAK